MSALFSELRAMVEQKWSVASQWLCLNGNGNIPLFLKMSLHHRQSCFIYSPGWAEGILNPDTPVFHQDVCVWQYRHPVLFLVLGYMTVRDEQDNL